MLRNRYTLSLGAVSLLLSVFSIKSADAFSMPEMNMPTISMPAPSFPSTPSIQTHIQITNTTNQISSPTATPTPSNTPTKTQVQTVSPMPLPSWFKPITSFFNWVTPTPTKQVSPTSTPTPTRTQSTPTATTQPPQSSLLDAKQQYMLNAINTYRAKNGLSSVKPSKELCDFAKVRAKEIVTDFSHSGWERRVNNGSIPFSYSMLTENIAMTSDYTNVVNLWINSPGHAANMRADTPYVCVAYSGNYYAYEGMRP